MSKQNKEIYLTGVRWIQYTLENQVGYSKVNNSAERVIPSN